MLLPASSSGFLVRVDEAALLESAVAADAVLLFDRLPGAFLVAGTPVGAAWPRETADFDAETRSRLCQQAAAAVFTGVERTQVQDVAFGLRQLTDVANKALSPGINDPTTAVHALGHSAALLCELAGRDLGPRLLDDEQGRLRVVIARPGLDDLLELALTQPRRYGAADPAVLARLTELLRELAWVVRSPEERRAIGAQLARLRTTTAAQDFGSGERAHLATLAEHVEDALGGCWYRMEETP